MKLIDTLSLIALLASSSNTFGQTSREKAVEVLQISTAKP